MLIAFVVLAVVGATRAPRLDALLATIWVAGPALSDPRAVRLVAKEQWLQFCKMPHKALNVASIAHTIAQWRVDSRRVSLGRISSFKAEISTRSTIC